MFSDINAESTRRLTEAKSLVLLIKNEDLMRSLNLDSKVHKGAFFVLLYGALEYTITAVVQRCISILNRDIQQMSLKSKMAYKVDRV